MCVCVCVCVCLKMRYQRESLLVHTIARWFRMRLNKQRNYISPKFVYKYLGAYLDDWLSLRVTINRKSWIAMSNLQKIKLIRKSPTLRAAKTIAIWLVISHLDYADTLYSGLPNTEVSKLQRIQNMTVKTITGARKYGSSTEALKALH